MKPNETIVEKGIYQMIEHLYKRLKNYSAADYYAFHMPGHKRNQKVTGADLPYSIDITEIDGFDDLHHADGILKELQENAARLFHAEETHYLVNGSTVGLLSAVMGCTERGGRILMARNCHKSVYNAVYMNELRPVYVYPEFLEETDLNGEIQAEQVEEALEQYTDIQAVVLVSPTYDGVVSNIEKIAKIAHNYGIPLIVDEAHGAHFGFHSYFPENANTKGADVVIHSLHKTLPSLTQTALLHINGEIVKREKVRNYLHMLQSSSPSYILMASIDECVRVMEERGISLMDTYVTRLNETREKLKRLKNLKLIETEHYDRSKLVISVRDLQNAVGEDINGRMLQEMLRDYHLEMEMAAGSYVIAMTGPGDKQEGMDRLVAALEEIDHRLLRKEEEQDRKEAKSVSYKMVPLEQVLSSYEAGKQNEKSVKWEESTGETSLEYVYLYPPGIPMIVPGERITSTIVEKMVQYEKIGFSIEGLKRQHRISVSADIEKQS